jgi:nicotinamide-nucleotide amidase
VAETLKHRLSNPLEVPIGIRVSPSRLARQAGHALRKGNHRLVTAESCTGGGIAEWITRIPGSSEWFERGYVTYSNEAKMELLDVRSDTLVLHGAVSEEIAREMAIGAMRHSHADIAVAVTGIAGPDGGTPDKPVGTVCMAWADDSGHVVSVRVLLPGDRHAVRRQAAALALTGVIDIVRN